MFVIQYTEYKESFFQHIDNIDSAIKFILEDMRTDDSMPFLQTLVSSKHNETPNTSVYRKLTHTDQYMYWDNHHYIGVKYSVMETLTNRTKTVPSMPQLLSTEKQLIWEVLTNCKYPSLAIDEMQVFPTKQIIPGTTKNTQRKHKQRMHSYTTCTRAL